MITIGRYPLVKSFFFVLFLLLLGATAAGIPFVYYRGFMERWINLDAGRGYDGDFRYFVTGSRMMREGEWEIYRENVCSRYGIKSTSVMYPPTFYLLMMPFSLISFKAAANIWLILKTISIIGTAVFLSFLVLGYEARPLLRSAVVVLIAIAMVVSSPTLEDLLFGQMNLPLLFLLCLAWFLIVRNRPIAGGIILGVIFCIKFVSAFIILYLLLRKKWREALSAIGFILVMELIVTILYGPGIFIEHFKRLVLASPFMQCAFNQAIGAQLNMRFANTGISVSLLSGIFILAMAGVTTARLLVKKTGEDLSFSFALLVTFTLPISVLVWPSHHVWFFFPFAYLAGTLVRKKDWGGLTGAYGPESDSSFLFPCPFRWGYLNCFGSSKMASAHVGMSAPGKPDPLGNVDRLASRIRGKNKSLAGGR